MRAVDLAGAEILGAVEGDQHVIAEPAEVIQAAGLLKLVQHRGIDRMQQVRLGRIQHGADVVIGRDAGQAEQAFAVRAPVAFLQPALVGQEGRALHEEHRERRQPDVGHGIGRVVSPPRVGEVPAAFSQTAEQGAKALHPAVESYCAPVSIDPGSPSSLISTWCGNPNSPPPYASGGGSGLRVAIAIRPH